MLTVGRVLLHRRDLHGCDHLRPIRPLPLRRHLPRCHLLPRPATGPSPCEPYPPQPHRPQYIALRCGFFRHLPDTLATLEVKTAEDTAHAFIYKYFSLWRFPRSTLSHNGLQLLRWLACRRNAILILLYVYMPLVPFAVV